MNGTSRIVREEQNGDGPSAKRRKDVFPWKIKREVQTPDVAADAAAAAVAEISITTVLVMASSEDGIELPPAKRAIAGSTKARELAERRRSGDHDRYSDEWDDETGDEDDGESKDGYYLPERRHAPASKPGRPRLSAMAPIASENYYDGHGSDEAKRAGASRSNKIANKAPWVSPGGPSKRPLKAATTTAVRSAAMPAAGRSKRKSLASQTSDALPVTTGMSDSNAASRPAMQSPSSSSFDTAQKTLAAASGSAPLTWFAHLPLVVWPADLAAALAASTQAGQSVEQQSPIALPVVLRLPAGECSAFSTGGLATIARRGPLEVPALVVETVDGYQLSSFFREPAGALTGINRDEACHRRSDLQTLDGGTQPSADAHDTVHWQQTPVTSAVPKGNDPSDQLSLKTLAVSKPPAAAERHVLSEGSARQGPSASSAPSSVSAAHVLCELRATCRSDDRSCDENAIGSSSIGRAAADGLGRESAAGSVAVAAQNTEVAAAPAVGVQSQSSNPMTVACNVCNKLIQKYDLRKHVRNVHSGHKPHRCPYCDYATPWKGNLNTHIAGVHQNARSHECSQCGYRFKTHCAMIGHMRKVHDRMYQPTERKFECDDCHAKFFKKIHLQQHMRVHSGEKPFVCVVYDKKCTRLLNKDDHIEVSAGSLLPVVQASSDAMLLPATPASLSLTSAGGQPTRGISGGRKRGGQRRLAADLDGPRNRTATFSV